MPCWAGRDCKSIASGLQNPESHRAFQTDDGPPFVELGIADAVLAAQLRDWRAALGLLEDGDVLAIGKTGRLHAEPSKI